MKTDFKITRSTNEYEHLIEKVMEHTAESLAKQPEPLALLDSIEDLIKRDSKLQIVYDVDFEHKVLGPYWKLQNDLTLNMKDILIKRYVNRSY